MAADGNDENKTEEPSDRKKEKAHQEGQIAYTKEIGTTLGFVAVMAILFLNGAQLFQSSQNHFVYIFSHLEGWKNNEIPLVSRVLPSILPLLKILGLILFAAFVGPIVGHILQKGIDPKYEAAAPSFDKLNPAKAMKQVFSLEALVNFVKNIVKTLGLMYIFYLTIKPYTDKLIHIAAMPFEDALALTTGIFARFTIYATIFLIVIAAIDYFVSWRRIHSQLMMSRHELKEEMKEIEGNPQMKGKLKQIQHERSKRQIKKDVPQAAVVITNPTHFAVALKYKKGEVPIPIVVAKGADFLAKRIREVATESRVPIVENQALARALYKEVKTGREIPQRFYKAVAKIIAAILRVEEEKKMKNR